MDHDKWLGLDLVRELEIVELDDRLDLAVDPFSPILTPQHGPQNGCWNIFCPS
jgi:hypothetical protein